MSHIELRPEDAEQLRSMPSDSGSVEWPRSLQQRSWEARFSPNRPWDNTVPGRLAALMEDSFPHAELRSDFDRTITVDSESESIFALPWTFLVSSDEQVFLGINRDRLTIHTPGDASHPWHEIAPMMLTAWEQYVATSKPAGHRRMGMVDTHRFFYHHDDGPEFSVSDLFHLSPRFAGEIPGSFGQFQILMDLRFDGDGDDIVRINLRTDGALEEPSVIVFALTLDYMRLLGPALERESVETWLQAANRRLTSAFDAIVKPAALGTLGATP